MLKKFIITLILVIAVWQLAKFSTSAFLTSSNTRQVDDTVLQQLQDMAEKINKTLPMKLDDEHRFDSLSIENGNKVVYKQTLLGYASAELDTSIAGENLKKYAVEKSCRNKKMTELFRYGVIYVYIFFGNDGKEIARINIDKNYCEAN